MVRFRATFDGPDKAGDFLRREIMDSALEDLKKKGREVQNDLLDSERFQEISPEALKAFNDSKANGRVMTNEDWEQFISILSDNGT